MERLKKLKKLERMLNRGLRECDDYRLLPQLAKQYRDTIREIEEIEGADSDDDEISEILTGRSADGKPGAVRKSRTNVPEL